MGEKAKRSPAKKVIGKAKKTTKRKVPTVKAARLAVSDAGGSRVGRPCREFEPDTGDAITKAIAERGLDLVTAGDMCGVHRQILSRWIQGNEQFASAIKKAQANHIAETLDRLRQLPAGQWTKAAWELERIYPERFSQNQRIEVFSSQRLEINAAVCTQLNEGWQQFRANIAKHN